MHLEIYRRVSESKAVDELEEIARERCNGESKEHMTKMKGRCSPFSFIGDREPVIGITKLLKNVMELTQKTSNAYVLP